MVPIPLFGRMGKSRYRHCSRRMSNTMAGDLGLLFLGRDNKNAMGLEDMLERR